MKKTLLTVLFFLVCASASAHTYNLTVNKVEQDKYEDSKNDTTIETQSCYEYAKNEAAVLDWNGNSGTLTFLDSKVTCAVMNVE